MLTDRPLAGKKEPYARSVIPIFQLICLLAAFLFLRVLLFFKFGPHSISWIDILRSFGVGFHLDLFVALLLVLPLLLWLSILPARWYSARWHGIALRLWLFAAWTMFCFGSIAETEQDRKSTRLNSSHRCISYAVFCLKKKKNINNKSG